MTELSTRGRQPVEAWLDRLEELTFAADVGIASDLRTALRVVSSHPIVVSLRRWCERSPSDVGWILQRVEALSACQIDVRYASPFDSAMLAHLYLLERFQPALVASAAVAVNKAPNTWWARKYASRLLESLGDKPRLAGRLEWRPEAHVTIGADSGAASAGSIEFAGDWPRLDVKVQTGQPFTRKANPAPPVREFDYAMVHDWLREAQLGALKPAH